MRSVCRNATFMSLALALAGCQATGTNNWVPSSSRQAPATESVTDQHPSGSAPSMTGANAISFEIGRDLYAYNDIPPGVRPASETMEGGLW